jgi:hypothetical protein
MISRPVYGIAHPLLSLGKNCEETSASSRTTASWVNGLIESEERDLKETLALRN